MKFDLELRNLSRNVRVMREDRRETIDQFAENCAVDAWIVQNLEMQIFRDELTVYELIQFGRYLNVHASDLFLDPEEFDRKYRAHE